MHPRKPHVASDGSSAAATPPPPRGNREGCLVKGSAVSCERRGPVTSRAVSLLTETSPPPPASGGVYGHKIKPPRMQMLTHSHQGPWLVYTSTLMHLVLTARENPAPETDNDLHIQGSDTQRVGELQLCCPSGPQGKEQGYTWRKISSYSGSHEGKL